MKTWLTIIAIRLGIVKIICPVPSYDSISRWRMKKLGIRFKDVARALRTNETSIIENLLERKILRKEINQFIKNAEAER